MSRRSFVAAGAQTSRLFSAGMFVVELASISSSSPRPASSSRMPTSTAARSSLSCSMRSSSSRPSCSCAASGKAAALVIASCNALVMAIKNIIILYPGASLFWSVTMCPTARPALSNARTAALHITARQFGKRREHSRRCTRPGRSRPSQARRNRCHRLRELRQSADR